MTEAEFIAEHADLFCCPACAGSLQAGADDLRCAGCGRSYDCASGIPRMFVPHDWDPAKGDVTEDIQRFYEATPFPDYDDLDSAGRLVEKARQSVFARLLDEQLPFGARVLEAGCGTGQLTSFLSVANRAVFGTDLCLNSLTLAKAFRDANHLTTARFLQMNLFKPCFRPGTFDLVISNGVLHHTSDPFRAFETLSRLVKPGGHLVVGLYHRYGRLATNLRRIVFRLSRDRWAFLDPRAIDRNLGAAKRRAWFMDQYKNPHESSHTIGEVMGWLQRTGLTFVRSIPTTLFGGAFSDDERLFEPDATGGPIERTLVELSMMTWRSQIKEGGFFIVIGRRDR